MRAHSTRRGEQDGVCIPTGNAWDRVPGHSCAHWADEEVWWCSESRAQPRTPAPAPDPNPSPKFAGGSPWRLAPAPTPLGTHTAGQFERILFPRFHINLL